MMRLSQLASELSQLVALSAKSLHWVFAVLAILWGIHCVNALIGYRLNYLGIVPRAPWSVLGIVCSPLLHGNFNHLFFNSAPLFILLSLMLLTGLTVTIQASLLIILISGSAIWLFGRSAIHIGASSVIMGYWSFLLSYAFLQNSIVLMALLLIICIYYLGGLFFSLFPGDSDTSWEGHLFGALAGLVTAYLI